MPDVITNRLSVSGRVLPMPLIPCYSEKSIATLPRIEFVVTCGKERVVTISNRNKNVRFLRIPVTSTGTRFLSILVICTGECFPRISLPRAVRRFLSIPLPPPGMVSPHRTVKINRNTDLIESALSPSKSAAKSKSIGNFHAFRPAAGWTCFSQNVNSLVHAGVLGGCS
jgi:hypothetical protein